MVYPIMIIGWVSLCNYSILGALRSISQIITFGILLFLVCFLLIILIEEYSFYIFVKFQYNIIIFFMYPLYVIFIVRALIDLNRIPFNLIEGQSELAY